MADCPVRRQDVVTTLYASHARRETMKKIFGMTAIAVSMLMFANGTANAWQKSTGGITGIDRLRPGTPRSSVRRSAPARMLPNRAEFFRPSQPDTGSSRSFSFEPENTATPSDAACCTPQPTCCSATPSCAGSAPVSRPKDVAPAPPIVGTIRSFSFEPESVTTYRPRRASSRNRSRDRMYRKLHPGSN